MSRYIFLLLMLVSCNSSMEKKEKITQKEQVETNFFLGTYTDGESKGIYKYSINEKGMMKKNGLVATSDNPSFLCYSPSREHLIAVNEINSNDGTGTVESYKIGSEKLEFINRSSSGGAHPCFVTCNKDGVVLTANYTGGNIGLLNISTDGKLTPPLDVQQHEGKGTTERQEGPHAHSTWFAPNNDQILSVDLGTNQIWFSTLSASNDKLIPSKQKTLNFPEGAGPRHLTFHPNGKWIYVLNELTGSVSKVVINTKNEYEIVSTVSSLDPTFKAFNKSADIHVSNDGRYLYASNRGPNTIGIFNIDQTSGALKLIASDSTRGEMPRNFSLTPDQKYLVVANQDSNNLISFKRDLKTGLLPFVNEIAAPKPVCILF